jgi:hypothetical protein
MSTKRTETLQMSLQRGRIARSVAFYDMIKALTGKSRGKN